MKKTFTLFGILFIFTTTINSQIIHVPADQPSIQEGIEAASEGDTVLVANGTYLENINFMGKAITVASNFIIDNDTNHISNTIIDGSEPDDPDFGSVVSFDSGEDTTSVLCGFTVTGGTGTEIQGFNSRSGGGIQSFPAGCKLINNYIEYNIVNSNGGAYGGGILCDHEDQSCLVLINNKIRFNQINGHTEAQGAGVGVFGNARITYNEITGNSSNSVISESTGGLACQGGFYNTDLKEIYISNNKIKNNTAQSMTETGIGAAGGGLIVMYYYGLINNNIIENNTISSGESCLGAGAYLQNNSTDLIFEKNIVKGNSFLSGICYGGGIGVTRGEATLNNNFISNNQATYGGGAYYWVQSTGTVCPLINNTITKNEASNSGGGLCLTVSNLVVINTILWDNEASEEGAEIYESDSELEVRHSNVEGGWPGNGNMDVEPLFKSDGYHLDVWSTLLNEGTSSILINGEWYDCPEYDIDGDERPFSSEAEIGADEAMWNYVDIGETVKEELTFSIYPNPASSIVNFSIETDHHLPQQTELILYNSFGEIVQSFKVNNGEGRIPVHQMPAGIYLIKCKTGGQEIIKRLVIIR